MISVIVGQNIPKGGDLSSFRFATFRGLLVGFSIIFAFVYSTTYIGFVSPLVQTLQNHQKAFFPSTTKNTSWNKYLRTSLETCHPKKKYLEKTRTKVHVNEIR